MIGRVSCESGEQDPARSLQEVQTGKSATPYGASDPLEPGQGSERRLQTGGLTAATYSRPGASDAVAGISDPGASELAEAVRKIQREAKKNAAARGGMPREKCEMDS